MSTIVLAATADDRKSTEALARESGLTFPMSYGTQPSQLEPLDPWWVHDRHGHYHQPMEFLVMRDGTVFGSLYASGPIGRMDVNEVLVSIKGREKLRVEQEKTI